MAQHSHVPKFGNWETDNVPYTTYFENARRDRGAGGKIINPNDPEQCPDAFIFGTMTQEYDTIQKHGREEYNDFETHRAVHAHPPWTRSDKQAHNAKQRKEYQYMEEEGFDDYMEVPRQQSFSQDKVVLNPQRSANHKGRNSESGSEKSNSDSSLLKSHRNQGRSMQTKSSAEGSNNLKPSPPRQARLKSGNTQGEHHRGASVPKFGAWDERDPRSGEGFTVIFNKVKREKQIGASKFPVLPVEPVEPVVNRTSLKNHDNSTLKSKICGCLFSRE